MPEDGRAPAVEAGTGFACPNCGRQLASAMAVTCHATHAHGRKRPAHAFKTTSVCPACGNDYRMRLRALEHVERGSKVCRLAVLGGGMLLRPPVEVAAADAADQQWRRSARQRGVADLAGPPALVPERVAVAAVVPHACGRAASRRCAGQAVSASLVVFRFDSSRLPCGERGRMWLGVLHTSMDMRLQEKGVPVFGRFSWAPGRFATLPALY